MDGKGRKGNTWVGREGTGMEVSGRKGKLDLIEKWGTDAVKVTGRK